jgi:hypothetical protein
MKEKQLNIKEIYQYATIPSKIQSTTEDDGATTITIVVATIEEQ